MAGLTEEHPLNRILHLLLVHLHQHIHHLAKFKQQPIKLSNLVEYYLMDIALAVVVSLASIEGIGINGDIAGDLVFSGEIRYHPGKRLVTLNQFLSANHQLFDAIEVNNIEIK